MISLILLECIPIIEEYYIFYVLNPTNEQKPNLSKTILLFMNSEDDIC